MRQKHFVVTIPLGGGGGVELPSGLIAGQHVSQPLTRFLSLHVSELPTVAMQAMQMLPSHTSDTTSSNRMKESAQLRSHLPLGLATLLLTALLAPTAQAQAPFGPYEVFVGYSYLDVEPGEDTGRIGMHGGHVEVFFPVRGAFGPVFDVSAHFGTLDPPPNTAGISEVEIAQLALLFGGRYAGLRSGRFAAALQATTGFSTGRAGEEIEFQNLGIESTALAAALGGSLSYNVSDRLALRLQPHLFLTTFDGEVQANGRYSAGLVVTFR